MARPRAFCLIQGAVHYRRDAFEAGLKACGFAIAGRPDASISSRDVLVIWNRYGSSDSFARQFEQIGAAVIVGENGYIGESENAYAKPFATKEQTPDSHLYALALNYHNGAGRWWIGAPGRWRAQGIMVKSWRTAGTHVLVLGQRGFGHPRVAPPRDWLALAHRRLQAMTKRPIRVRAHPGNEPAQRPLEADLEGAWACVTWGSGAGIKSICHGVPVFSDWPQWIGAFAATPLCGNDIEKPKMDDYARIVMLDRLAWLQHTVAEIATGEPIRRLLELHKQHPEAA